MKNVLKYMFGAVLSILTLAACTNEYTYDAPSATEQGGNATISVETASYVFVPSDDQDLMVTITRVDATSAQEIGLTCDNPKFAVPSTVSFAAGEKSKDVVFKSSLVAGESESAVISISGADAFLYGANSVKLNVSVYRSFTGMIQTAFYGEDPWEIDIYELGDGDYMIPNAFADGYDLKFNIDFKTNQVKIPAQYIDYHSDDYGAIGMTTSTATYDPENLLITATSTFSLPAIEYTFGTGKVYIVFDEDPQQ
jgi:hypothetical protein